MQRPLPKHLIEGAVFNVCNLRKLRLDIMSEIMSEVTAGTNLYLKDVSELSEDSVGEKRVRHFIMSAFECLKYLKKFFIGSFDSIEFQRLRSSANVAEWRVFS